MVSTDDFAHLRRSLFGFLALAMCGLLAVLSAWQFRHFANASYQRAVATQIALQERVGHLREDEAAYRQAEQQFREWATAGIVGHENRAAWIAKIQQIKQRRKVASLSYELAPRRPLEGTPTEKPAKFQLMVSTMQLHMRLLNEEDLIHVLNDLARDSQAFVRPRQCTIERLIPNIAEPGALLTANCQLDWLTIMEAP